MGDYRSVDGTCPFNDISAKKDKLLAVIKKDHPRASNHYSLVSDKKDALNYSFSIIYDQRCAYCGVNLDILKVDDYEVDHFICKKSKEEGINHLTNLVHSCKYCNRNKGEYYLNSKSRSLLNPDSKLGEVFYRDELMTIRPVPEYENDEDVMEFYNKIQFGFERRRIEFLLMSMIEYEKELTGDDQRCMLKAIEIIRQSYNRTHWK